MLSLSRALEIMGSVSYVLRLLVAMGLLHIIKK